jgi:predicted metal-dependent hydrolase
MVMTILPRALRFAIVSSPLSASSSGRARSTSIVSVPSSKSAISLLSESRLVPAMIIWPVRPAAARRPLEVIVPRGTTDAEVDELLEEKRYWVERKVATAREIARHPPRLGLERPGLVWLGGEQLPLERRNGRRSVATLDDRRLLVSGSSDQAPAAVVRWYRREARRRIESVLAREAERLGLEYRSLGIRDPRTRWGSCSRKGHLSFSWRLAAAPPEILDYVVVHELCHLREPNHQKPFWRLLETAQPGWQEQARWLRQHGQELHDYDPGRVLPT